MLSDKSSENRIPEKGTKNVFYENINKDVLKNCCMIKKKKK